MGTKWGYSIILKIWAEYHLNATQIDCFNTKYTHPTLICRGTDARTDARTENIYSIFRDKLLLLGEHVYHDKWVADTKSFSLPATHLFRSKSGKTPPEGGNSGSSIPTLAATTTAASVTSVNLQSSRVGPLIAQYKTNTEDRQFASFLADFERALN